MTIWAFCMVCPHAWKVWTKLHKVKENTIQITLMWLNMVCFQHNVVIYWLQHLETDKLYILKISLFQKTQLDHKWVDYFSAGGTCTHCHSLHWKVKKKQNRVWAILFCTINNFGTVLLNVQCIIWVLKRIQLRTTEEMRVWDAVLVHVATTANCQREKTAEGRTKYKGISITC